MVEIRITYSYAYVQIIAQLLSERLIPFVALDVRRYELSFLPVRSVCVRLEIWDFLLQNVIISRVAEVL